MARTNEHTYSSVGVLSIDAVEDPCRRLFQDTLFFKVMITLDAFASFLQSTNVDELVFESH